jgi:hypothetical protein
MSLRPIIDWYARGAFNAADVQRATRLSERSQRELLKLGILQAIPQSRTATRLFDSQMVKRAALIHPLNEYGGFNLLVSGKLIYANTILESLLYDVIDPWQAYNRMIEKVPGGESEWRWFSSKEGPTAESSDYYISLINRYYVASGQADAPRVYGHLTEDRTDIVVYRGAVWENLIKASGRNSKSLPNEFSPKSALVGRSRHFQSKEPDKNERAAVVRAINSPISKFSINASLTLRVAMRRLLKIDGDPS